MILSKEINLNVNILKGKKCYVLLILMTTVFEVVEIAIVFLRLEKKFYSLGDLYIYEVFYKIL